MQIWTPVKVVNPDHPNSDEAGTVQAINPEKPEEVGVRFDKSNDLIVCQKSDLQPL